MSTIELPEELKRRILIECLNDPDTFWAFALTCKQMKRIAISLTKCLEYIDRKAFTFFIEPVFWDVREGQLSRELIRLFHNRSRVYKCLRLRFVKDFDKNPIQLAQSSNCKGIDWSANLDSLVKLQLHHCYCHLPSLIDWMGCLTNLSHVEIIYACYEYGKIPSVQKKRPLESLRIYTSEESWRHAAMALRHLMQVYSPKTIELIEATMILKKQGEEDNSEKKTPAEISNLDKWTYRCICRSLMLYGSEVKCLKIRKGWSNRDELEFFVNTLNDRKELKHIKKLIECIIYHEGCDIYSITKEHLDRFVLDQLKPTKSKYARGEP